MVASSFQRDFVSSTSVTHDDQILISIRLAYYFILNQTTVGDTFCAIWAIPFAFLGTHGSRHKDKARQHVDKQLSKESILQMARLVVNGYCDNTQHDSHTADNEVDSNIIGKERRGASCG